MRHQYPAEFCQRVLALVEGGAKVADVAADLDVAVNTIYNWRNQHLIDDRISDGKLLISACSPSPGERRADATWIIRVLGGR